MNQENHNHKNHKLPSNNTESIYKPKISKLGKTIGRPTINLPPLPRGKFCIEDLYLTAQKRTNKKDRLTRVAVGLKLQKLLKDGKIKLAGKRPPANKIGQPVKIFEKVKEVKQLTN